MGEGQPDRVRGTVRPQFESAIWRPRIFPLNGLCCDRGVIAKRIIVTSNINLTLSIMTPLILATPMLAAAGWAFLVYVLGGGGGLALAVFIILKLMGK